MAVNSHYAAALVKLRRPEIEWVAEFSDPLKINPLGEERTGAVAADWLSGELAAGMRAAGFERRAPNCACSSGPSGWRTRWLTESCSPTPPRGR